MSKFRAIGPILSQPGAQPQEKIGLGKQGPKARSMSWQRNCTGFQPFVFDRCLPGAAPQAGIARAFGAVSISQLCLTSVNKITNGGASLRVANDKYI